jgi:hypothetical protein
MNAKLLSYNINRICDICDNKNEKVTAHIQDVIGNIHVFCIECLNKIVLESPSKVEIEK